MTVAPKKYNAISSYIQERRANILRRMKIGGVEVLTLKEAEERIGVSHVTLQKQAQKGALRAVLVGKQWLVTLEEIDRYVSEYKGKPGRPRKQREVG